MRYLWILATLICNNTYHSSAQQCEDCRYISEVFSSLTVDTVEFGEGINADGNNQKLFMDIYEPVGDTMTNRPVLVFVFGGGFIQGDRFEKHVVKTCERYAKSGYVAVGIDYRIGIDFIAGISGPEKEMMRVFFRAMQDLRAAVQYMKYSADSLGNPYNIDPDKIFIGGASAGGITSLLVEYADKVSEFSELADTSAIDALGGFMATSANGPHASYDWSSIGVINIAGAIPDTSWMEPGDVPVLNVHGDQDGTVDYVETTSLGGLLPVTLLGSYLVDIRGNNTGQCSYLYTMPGEDHPSNGKSDYYFENIYDRLMPRMKAVIEGNSYCCSHSISILGDTLREIEASGNPIFFNAELQNAAGTPAIKWCSNPCSETGQQLGLSATPNPDPIQYYIVTATDNNCIASDMVAVQVADSLVSAGPVLKSTSLLSIYPNPVSNQLIVEWGGNADLVQIQVLDMLGKELKALNLQKGTNQLSVSDLHPGYYLYRINSGNDTQHIGKLQVLR